MKDRKLIIAWEKTRRRGLVFYILECVVLILASSVIGKVIGEYIFNGSILRSFHTQDFIGLLFIGIISILLGMYLWNYNEKRYKKLKKG